MSNALTTSYPYFAMPNQAKPIYNGEVYVGAVGTDPTVPGNQVEVRHVQEDGSEVPVSQPLKLSSGGILVLNGSPAKFVVTGSFSMAVYDQNGTLQTYDPNTYPTTQ